jgi:hypothetical protein
LARILIPNSPPTVAIGTDPANHPPEAA